MTNYSDAISSIESGGRYSLVGPATASGDRAYGRYQVMGANVPEWTRAALGQPMTPQQFLASPQAQDAVFNHKFGQYAAKYGAEGAARAWFAGEGGMNDPNRRDVLGTSVSDYARKFNTAMGTQAPAQQPAQAQPPAPGSPLNLMSYAAPAPTMGGSPMPLFGQPAQQPAPQQPQQAPAPASLWSMLAPPTSQADVANWFSRQNPTG